MKKDATAEAPPTTKLSPVKSNTMEKPVTAKSGKRKRRRAVLSGSLEAMKVQERGIIYLSHIPHGFYETQMFKFFSQFGKISNMKMGRSKRTGKPRGYAFIEFRHQEVAKIVAETMNNYLMFNKLLKCKVLTPEQVRPSIFKNRINPNRPPKVQSRILSRKGVNAEISEEQSFKRILKTFKRAKKANKKLSEMGIQVPILEVLKTGPKPLNVDKPKEPKEKEIEQTPKKALIDSVATKNGEKKTPKPILKLSPKLESSQKKAEINLAPQTPKDVVKEKKKPSIGQEPTGATPDKTVRKLSALTPKMAIETKTPKSSKEEKMKKMVEALTPKPGGKTPLKTHSEIKTPKSMKAEKTKQKVEEALTPKPGGETPLKTLSEIKTPKSLKAEKVKQKVEEPLTPKVVVAKNLQKGKEADTPGNKKSTPIETNVIKTPKTKTEVTGSDFAKIKTTEEKIKIHTPKGDTKLAKITPGGEIGTPKSKPATNESGQSGKFTPKLLDDLKRKFSSTLTKSEAIVSSPAITGKNTEGNLKKRMSLPAGNMNPSVKSLNVVSVTPKDKKRKAEETHLNGKASTSFSVESARTPKQLKTEKTKAVETPKESKTARKSMQKSPFVTPSRRRASTSADDNVDLSALLGVFTGTPAATSGKTPSVTPKKTPGSSGKKNNSMVMIVDDEEDEITMKTPPNTLKIKSTNNSRANSRIGSALNTPNREGGAGSELSLQRGIVEKLKTLHQDKNLTPKSDKKKKM